MDMSSGTFQSTSTYSDSSKSGSNKSGDGSNKDRDLSKDNTTSPIDLECNIQAERIMKILNEAVHKTKLALTLPALVQEYRTLNSVLSRQHVEDLLFIFEQYENPLFSTSLLNMAALEDIKTGDLSLKNRLNPELGHLIYIMFSYPALKPKVDQLIAEMKNEYFSLTETQSAAIRYSQVKVGYMMPIGLRYLLVLEQFTDLMMRQMNTTAAEELATKLDTRRVEKSNEKLIAEIQELEKTIKEEQEQFEKNMCVKMETVDQLETELRLLNHDANIKLKKKILDSERQMVLASRAHAVKAEMLNEEETECKEIYDTLLRVHLAEEKNMRQRKFKVVTQLITWIQKYDTEMSDKQVELDDFTEKYEEEVQKCEELESKLAEQDKDYIPLMEEREKEYHEEMSEKLQKFLLEHAARVIQNAWRDVLANRAEKKKLKKLLAKMKAVPAKKP